jgi:hypothetical protein
VFNVDVCGRISSDACGKVGNCPTRNRDFTSTGDRDANTNAGSGQRETIQVDPDPVCPGNQPVASAGDIVIELQIGHDGGAAQTVCRLRRR